MKGVDKVKEHAKLRGGSLYFVMQSRFAHQFMRYIIIRVSSKKTHRIPEKRVKRTYR